MFRSLLRRLAPSSSSLASFAATLALGSLAFAHEGWIADFDEAVKVAKAEKKDLFVDFTGSDWCGWCIRLNKEVFDHEEFLTAIKKDFVLVSLDYPRDPEVKAKVPNPARNAELAKKYAIRGYPTILLMTPDGDVFGQTGYEAGGPAKYVESVTKLRTNGKKEVEDAKKVVDAWKNAKGEEQAKAWDALAATYEGLGEGSYAARALTEPVRSALDADKDGKQGRRQRAVKALLKHGVADPAVVEAAKQSFPRNEDGVLERALEASFQSVHDDASAKAALAFLDEVGALGPFKDKKREYMLHAQAAFWSANNLDDDAAAKKFATRAKAVGGDNADMNKALDEILAKK